MKKNRIFFFAVLISVLSFACAAPQIIIPEIQYKTTTQVHNEQPDCRLEINAAFDNSTQTNILNAFFCYDKTIQYWENEYQLLEVQLNTLYSHGE